MNKSLIIPFFFFILFFFIQTALNAGGFEFPDNGTKSIGRGGAFEVKGSDLSLVNYNPAALTNLKGFNFVYNHNFVDQKISFKRAPAYKYKYDPFEKTYQIDKTINFPEVHNTAGWFVMGGMLGLSYDFGLKNFNFALSVFGPSAVGHTKFALKDPKKDPSGLWDPADPAKYSLVEKDLLMVYYTLSIAYKIMDNLSFGINLQYVDTPKIQYSMVTDGNIEKTVYPVNSDYDVLVKLNTSDRFSYAVVLGLLYKPLKFLEFAISSRVTPIYIKSSGTFSLDYIGNTISQNPKEHSKLSNNKVTLDLLLPPWIKTGVRYVYRQGDKELFDVELNFDYEFWSMLKSFDVGMDATLSLDDIGAEAYLKDMKLEKNWQDSWSIRLGGDYNLMNKDFLWLRAGGFYEKGSVPKEYSNIDVLSFNRLGLGGGFTVKLWRKLFFNAAFMYIFHEERNVSADETKVYQNRPGQLCKDPYTGENCDPNYKGKPGAPIGGGTYKTSIMLISAGIDGQF